VPTTEEVQPSGTPGALRPVSARPPGERRPLDLSRIAQDLQIRKSQVENVVQLLDEGNTIPFIARYRKERTGGLSEAMLRTIQERLHQLRQLAERKQTILRSIDNQGKLTPELRAAILSADHPRRLEDLYLPYKPKKRTPATTAREKGLGTLALAIWHSDPAVSNLAEVLAGMVNPEKELTTPEQVLEGVRHILAEMIAESADVRAAVRNVLWETGKLCTSKSDKLAEGQGLEYKDYFQFTEPIRHIPPHRIMAINRGEKENALHVRLEWDAEQGLRMALERLPLPLPGSPPPLPEIAAPPGAPPQTEGKQQPMTADSSGTGETPVSPEIAVSPEVAVPPEVAVSSEVPRMSPPPQPAITPLRQRAEALRQHPHADLLREATREALTHLLMPSLEREIRRELKSRAENHAVEVFARNLRSKLLAAPLRGRRVLAIDPGFRTGCKLAVLDEAGNLLENDVIYPHTDSDKRNEAKAKLEQLVRKHQIHVIALGNGTACRETEELISELIAELEARRRGEPSVPPTSETPAPPDTTVTAGETPALPAGETPALPAGETPALPDTTVTAGETPALPASETPVLPAGETPALPDASGSSSMPAEPAPQSPSLALQTEQTATTNEPPLPEALPDLAYVIVNEAGASVYATSPIGKEEFPHLDASIRSTISIGRRLQDPLSELVKIDPQHVGVGLYQHDVPNKELRQSLNGVVESCVNLVGVDLNTASVPLLRHVSGLNQLVARDIVEYRKKHGPFRNRQQLLEVNGLSEQRFLQAAGFLRIRDGDNPFDGTWIHPESYGLAEQILKDLGYTPEVLRQPERLAELRKKLKTVSSEKVAERLQAGVPTVQDILDALARPGYDPRDDLPPPAFRKSMLKIEDLQPGMELRGTVLNVVDFGAFIDIGLKDSGLVHISQMANRYVRDPYDIVSVGDVVKVWVLSVDKERNRVSLTLIAPGTHRKLSERKGAARPRRGERGERRRSSVPSGPHPERRETGTPQEEANKSKPPQQHGRRPLPPRGHRAPVGQGDRRDRTSAPGNAAPAPTPPPKQQQPLPSRKPKPRRQPPKPKLSQAALAGATPLGTFAELAAFWEAKKKEGAQSVPAAPPTDGSGEQQGSPQE